MRLVIGACIVVAALLALVLMSDHSFLPFIYTKF